MGGKGGFCEPSSYPYTRLYELENRNLFEGLDFYDLSALANIQT